MRNLLLKDKSLHLSLSFMYPGEVQKIVGDEVSRNLPGQAERDKEAWATQCCQLPGACDDEGRRQNPTLATGAAWYPFCRTDKMNR